ncbi:TPA: glycine betaine ABC transporter substrate-binding protein [Escherichia coli]
MPLSKVWAGSLVLLAAVSLPLQAASPVKVGSKIDTEGALLGNIILQVLESHGVPTVNKVQLGTTPVVRGAITSGELDIYPEYTGNVWGSDQFWAELVQPGRTSKPCVARGVVI